MSLHVTKCPCFSGEDDVCMMVAKSAYKANVWISRPPANHKHASATTIHILWKIWYYFPIIALENANCSSGGKWPAPIVFVPRSPITTHYARERRDCFA